MQAWWHLRAQALEMPEERKLWKMQHVIVFALEAEVDETPKPGAVRWLQRWHGQVAVVAGFGIAMMEVEMVEGTVVLEMIES